MNNNNLKTFIKFYEGRREQEKIDELLDIASQRKLTDEEKDLLKRLNKGELLPPEEKERTKLMMHKTGGGFLYDDQGNIMVQKGEGEKEGSEFVTDKGRTRQIDKLVARESMLNARVYRNRESEERFVYCYQTATNDSGITSNEWIIYRTISGPMLERFPFGQFLDTSAPKYSFFKRMTPEHLWKELDYTWDFGMVLNEELYSDFMKFLKLYKENQIKNKEILTEIRNKFTKLL
jgi:hypothetical protein